MQTPLASAEPSLFMDAKVGERGSEVGGDGLGSDGSGEKSKCKCSNSADLEESEKQRRKKMGI